MASDRRPPHGVILVPGWLDPALCDRIVSYANSQPGDYVHTYNRQFDPQKEAPRQGGEQGRSDSGRVTQAVDMGDFGPTIAERARAAFLEVAEPASGLRVEWFICQVLRYYTGGYYGVHADSERFDGATGTWWRFLNRDISLLLYLNDEYEGGKISFPNFNYRYQPGKGDLLIFPSDHCYLHAAEPVTGGVRYAAVGWAAAAGSVRVQDGIPEAAVRVR